jgi:oligosaccharide reducing-end xylanase
MDGIITMKIMSKSIRRLKVFSIACLFMQASYSQETGSLYEVATWYGFRQAAVNFTFDDGCSNQFTKAIPLFDEYDFNLTLFTVTDWSPNWSKLKQAADSGHEVASHTVSHPNFSLITATKQRTELTNSKAIIESNIPGRNCLTIAYPYCAPGIDSICDNYYIAARGCQGFIEPPLPGSFLNVSSIICGAEGSVKAFGDFKSRLISAAGMTGWCVFLIHGIDDDGGYSPLSSNELRNVIVYLSTRKIKYWVTTFLNAALYARERMAVSVIETSNLDTLITLQVTDTLPDSIYNHPVTIRRPLPDGWPSADVIQQKAPVNQRIVQVDTTVYIVFDAIPDGGEIFLIKNNNTVIPEIDTLPPDDDPISNINDINNENYSGQCPVKIVIHNNNLHIQKLFMPKSVMTVSLYDLSGKTLIAEKINFGHGNNSIQLPLSFTKQGFFLVKITDGLQSWTQKLFYSN